MKYIFLIIFLICANNSLYSQKKIISGYVADSYTKRVLEYVNVAVDGANQGTVTDEHGYFKLEINGNSGNVIISHLGYRSEIIKIKDFESDYPKYVELIYKELLLQEIAVYSSNTNSNNEFQVSSSSLENDQISKISNAMPDALRSIQALPGISVNNEFSAEFNVRGGNKDENLIEVNGTQVYEPYHLKEAPNASVGVFNVDLIDRVNIITGGFSARYGDRMSSVANIDYREGNNQNYSGAGTLSLAFVDGYLEGPFLNKGNFIIGARKTYMEYVIDMTDFGYENIRSADPSFYDVQGQIAYPLGKSDKLKLNFLHSADNFKFNPKPETSFDYYESLYKNQSSQISTENKSYSKQLGNYYSSLLDLEMKNFIGRSAFLNTDVSFYSQSDNDYTSWGTYFRKDIVSDNIYFDRKVREDLRKSKLNIQTMEIKSSLDWQLSPYFELQSGIGYKDINYIDRFYYSKYAVNTSNTISYPDTLIEDYGYIGIDYRDDSLFASSYKMSGYLENIIQIGKNIVVNIAGRADYFGMNEQLTFSPRANLAYLSNYGTIIRLAWGHYYQSPIYSQLKYSEASDSNTKAQKAIHYIFGIEQNLNLSAKSMSTLKIKFDIFYKDYKSLISSFYSHGERLAYSRENDALGFAKGFDMYVLLNIPGFYTSVSYSYLNSKEDKINDELGAYPRLTSQEHTLSWITDLELGRNWSFNTKFYYGSGFPFAEKYVTYNSQTDEYYWNKSETNNGNLPEYQRIDFRISKEFQFSSYKLKTFIEVSNAFNHKNIRGYEYSYDNKGNPVKYEITLWPILPSFGIRVEF
ncbi:MAG: TonB-dependent receptor [Ignavibacteriae bacterium]|nr:TonB-dependent receptor [Ignavibacteriota bacterium]